MKISIFWTGFKWLGAMLSRRRKQNI